MAVSFGSYNIWIDGSELSDKDERRDYELSVSLILKRFEGCKTGGAVLKAIKASALRLRILPYTKEAEKTAGTCNAYAAPLDVVQATSKGDPVISGTTKKLLTENNPIRRLLNLPQDPLMGSGEGSESIIRFSPQMWGYGGLCAPGQPGASPSEILLHEMIHSYRQMRGDSYALPVGGKLQYDNLEEFIAIVITNIYISDSSNSIPGRALRADHAQFTPLPAALSTSKGFLSHRPYEKLVGKLVADEPGLAVDLKEVQAAFNPIREYLSPSP